MCVITGEVGWGQHHAQSILAIFPLTPTSTATWHSLHEFLANVIYNLPLLLLVFGSARDTCLWDLSQAMHVVAFAMEGLPHSIHPMDSRADSSRTFPSWPLKAILRRSDMQSRHPSAPLLLPDERCCIVISCTCLLRVWTLCTLTINTIVSLKSLHASMSSSHHVARLKFPATQQLSRQLFTSRSTLTI